MTKIKTIILKEWAEVFKNRFVLFTVIFMPLFFTVLALVLLFLTRAAGTGDISSPTPDAFFRACPEGLTAEECLQIYFVSQFMLLFLLTPLIIPVNIAAYSIVGEKTTRSLEPLLATPITTLELLAGKNLAAAIPAVLATWASFLLYALGANLLLDNPRVVAALFDPKWWLAIAVVGPLLSILSVNFSLMVSSRVNDPRVAEQLSAVVILPLLLLFFGQLAGWIFLSPRLVVILALILVVLDALMVFLATRLFQRETILTRWR
ncbi:MAG: ABC transporter permease subunit [Chloroflexi bacterium]|nr:ABC transporter permease subunit [Chloroflexota bacterium]